MSGVSEEQSCTSEWLNPADRRVKGLRCENGAVNCIDPWTNAISEEKRGKLRFKRLEEIDPLMTR